MSLFFLMCSERSGSNLISKLLNGHRNICGPSTKHIVNPVARNLFRYGDLSVEKNWEELLHDIFRLMSVDFSIWRKSFSFEELKDIAVCGDIKSLIQNIFLEEAFANGKQHVFIKENHIYEFLPFLLTYFPESKFVYQVRDPRDMALSWKRSPDHPGGIVRAARQWKLDQQQSLKNYYLLKKLGKAHSLKYEDLINNNVYEVRRVLEFLGVPFDRGVFDFHKDKITQKNAEMQKAWNNLSREVIRDNSKKYLTELNAVEIKSIEKICWYEMKHLGYTPEFSELEILEVSDESLENLNREELSKIILHRSTGVLDNMSAKSRFYQR